MAELARTYRFSVAEMRQIKRQAESEGLTTAEFLRKVDRLEVLDIEDED